RVRVRNRDLERTIRLEPGDAMVLNLYKQEGLGFRRDLYGQSDYIQKKFQFRDGRLEKRGDWLFAVLQTQNKPEGLSIIPNLPRLPDGVQVMTTLEKDEGPAVPDFELQRARPRFVWFDVPAPAGPTHPSILCYPMWGYPAPAWSLNLA